MTDLKSDLAVIRAERIAELEADGQLDPACPGCKVFYEYYRSTYDPSRFETRMGPFAPWHRALSNCQSGKYPHCTCDTCF